MDDTGKEDSPGGSGDETPAKVDNWLRARPSRPTNSPAESSEEEVSPRAEALKRATSVLMKTREILDLGKNTEVVQQVLSRTAGLLENAEYDESSRHGMDNFNLFSDDRKTVDSVSVMYLEDQVVDPLITLRHLVGSEEDGWVGYEATLPFGGKESLKQNSMMITSAEMPGNFKTVIKTNSDEVWEIGRKGVTKGGKVVWRVAEKGVTKAREGAKKVSISSTPIKHFLPDKV